MSTIILKCHPGSRFHLGQSSMRQNESLTDSDELIHSDLLFSAFIHAASILGVDKPEIWKDIINTQRLKFSSAFYCLEPEDGKFIYLLPKPISLNTLPTEDHKKLKKIQFISLGVWNKGLLPQDWFATNGNCFQPNSQVVVLKDELNNRTFDLYKKIDTQKVKVRTTSDTGNLYTQTDLSIMGYADMPIHWYFGLEDVQLTEVEKIECKSIIELMGSLGIGGERSSGCGQIDSIVWENDLKINAIDKTTQYMSLSLAAPTAEEIQPFLAYQTISRGGMYFSDTTRVNMIDFLLEGAITSQPATAKCIDLSVDGKKLWRADTGFYIPLPPNYCLK